MLHLGTENVWKVHGSFNSKGALGCCSGDLARAGLGQSCLFKNDQLEMGKVGWRP